MKNIFIFIVLIAVSFSSFAQNRRSTTSTPASTPPKTSTKNTESSPKTPSSKTKKPTSSTKTTKENGSSEVENKASSTTESKSFLTPRSVATAMSTTIELGAYPSDANITLINIYGHLGLNFDISRSIFLGPYFRNKILSTHEYQVMNIEGKTIDISSFNEWGAGISSGAYLPLGRTLLLTPELRIGYNEYNMQDLNYNSTNKNFINHTYISTMLRMNLGLKLSEYTIFNLNGGYILPFYLKGNKTEAYDPGTFMYGVGIRFYMQKP